MGELNPSYLLTVMKACRACVEPAKLFELSDARMFHRCCRTSLLRFRIKSSSFSQTGCPPMLASWVWPTILQIDMQIVKKR